VLENLVQPLDDLVVDGADWGGCILHDRNQANGCFQPFRRHEAGLAVAGRRALLFLRSHVVSL
jgi:hypothetical protein